MRTQEVEIEIRIRKIRNKKASGFRYFVRRVQAGYTPQQVADIIQSNLRNFWLWE